DIEGAVDELELAIRGTRPFRRRQVAVELDAVAVGIAQVEGLAHAVVGGAFERDAGAAQALERVRERAAVRVADRDVIEPGRPGRGRRSAQALPGVEPDGGS